jgi:peptide/nickel transport system permease protein
MRVYIVRRLLLIIPTFILVTFISFLLAYITPGDITDAMMDPAGSPLDKEGIIQSLGLDAPMIVQYGRFLGILPQMDGQFHGFLQGSLGVSFWTKISVVKTVAVAWPVTLELGFLGLIVAQLIALPIGIYSALRQDKAGDYAARSFAILCISIPSFWLGTLIIVLPSIWWGYMPALMLIRFTDNPIGNLKMFIVPAVVVGMAMAGMTMRMTRTMMLEVLKQDYIRTAWSKGLTERVVVLRHALKNALIPVVTLIGLQLPVLLGGTVIIENIFGLPGMGRLTLEAMIQRDQPVIAGVMVLFAVVLVLVNLLADLTYAFLDPRVQYR